MGNNKSCSCQPKEICCEGQKTSKPHIRKQVSCCSTSATPNAITENNKATPISNAHWVTGIFKSPAGNIQQVNTQLTRKDRNGARWARWTQRRMSYTIQPNLYAVGHPNEQSPVLVTANYKLTFDIVRSNLSGIDAWLLVLDTRGINVWCAAGKRTFGTREIIDKIKATQLNRVVSHKKVILPQLGAPGVEAHKVKMETGFSVIYGPVRAEDISKFLEMGMQKTKEMRTVKFPVKERAVLTPIEITQSWKYFLYIGFVLLVFNTLKGGSILSNTLQEFLFFSAAILVGNVITPIALPWIPGRSFAWKGWVLGSVLAAFISFFFATGIIEQIIYFLMLPPISSFLALNFTGCTTYTNLSGVLKEMRISLPLMIISFLSGLILKIYYLAEGISLR